MADERQVAPMLTIGGRMDQASDISQPDRNWRPTLALAFTGAAIGIGLVVASGLSALALGWLPTVSTYFGLQSPEAISATQHSVAEDCTHLDPLGQDSWPNATASLRIGQVGERSYVGIDIRNARPHTYFTVWLGLVSADPLGGTDGRNPLTGGESTPLAPSGDLPYLLQSTGAGKGNDTQPSGFRTDGLGGADFRTRLDFRILDGTYPFERFPGWDADDERLPLRDPANHNVAIAGARSPYTLQIISHCTDGIGHGLVRGPHQVWFEWKPARGRGIESVISTAEQITRIVAGWACGSRHRLRRSGDNDHTDYPPYPAATFARW